MTMSMPLQLTALETFTQAEILLQRAEWLRTMLPNGMVTCGALLAEEWLKETERVPKS